MPATENIIHYRVIISITTTGFDGFGDRQLQVLYEDACKLDRAGSVADAWPSPILTIEAGIVPLTDTEHRLLLNYLRPKVLTHNAFFNIADTYLRAYANRAQRAILGTPMSSHAARTFGPPMPPRVLMEQMAQRFGGWISMRMEEA